MLYSLIALIVRFLNNQLYFTRNIIFVIAYCSVAQINIGLLKVAVIFVEISELPCGTHWQDQCALREILCVLHARLSARTIQANDYVARYNFKADVIVAMYVRTVIALRFTHLHR